MFNFFKKIRKKREALKARSALIQKISSEFTKGQGNALEAALVLHLTANNQESLCRLLITFGSSEIFILTKGDQRLADAAITKGPGDAPYVAVFSSRERASADVAGWGPFDKPTNISALELVFHLSGEVGIVVNPSEEYLRWAFTPEQSANLKTVLEGSFNYEIGGIYSVWSSDSYRAVKLLQTDGGGVHIRLYANKWNERPLELDPVQLTMSGENLESVQSIGHLPVTRGNFLSMGPKLITSVPVIEEDLEGYNIWKEAQGGYFGT